MNKKLELIFFLSVFLTGFRLLHAQSYISYVVGDTADAITPHLPGIVLAGGAGDNDDAMKWMLQRANGGDVVVLRVSNSNGYNKYFYTDLGVAVNSVETLVIPSADAATHPYVSKRIQQAEVLFIAGGDQADYVTYWKDSPVEDAINYLILEKQATVGGTSAGCAIQGQAYFAALNGTVGSQQALNSPYSGLMTVLYNDFLQHPWLQHTITDTHYDNPDRRGRHFAFLARLTTDYGFRAKGIGVDEYTAVCIDEQGVARVFGEHPNYDDYAYFLQANCVEPYTPEICTAGQKITWNRSQQAVKVYRVPGTKTGAYSFDLKDWETGSGGVWQDWYAEQGQFYVSDGASPADCYVGMNHHSATTYLVFPNPTASSVTLRLPVAVGSIISIALLDAAGRLVHHWQDAHAGTDPQTLTLTLPALTNGCYVLRLVAGTHCFTQPLLVQRP